MICYNCQLTVVMGLYLLIRLLWLMHMHGFITNTIATWMISVLWCIYIYQYKLLYRITGMFGMTLNSVKK